MGTAQTLGLLVGAMLLAGTGATAYVFQMRARSRARLYRDVDASPAGEEVPSTGWLRRWLSLAGFRGAAVPMAFGVICALSIIGALAVLWIVPRSGAIAIAANGVAGIPVVGPAFSRIVAFLPGLAALSVVAFPWLWVRAQRAARLEAIEKDLPLVLELLATLAEGGLGFDASLDRVLESEPADRPLAQELRLYQAEVLGGGSRVECLRRFAGRIEHVTVTSTVAALVQAEETGSGLADVLRPLAEDFRLRRRERALARAEALPEKLVFPLVLGFLPSLLVWTLGPSFHQLFNAVDAIMRGAQ